MRIMIVYVSLSEVSPVQPEPDNRRKPDQPPAYFPVEPGKTGTGNGAFQPESPGFFWISGSG